jgi:hypothetical protein
LKDDNTDLEALWHFFRDRGTSYEAKLVRVRSRVMDSVASELGTGKMSHRLRFPRIRRNGPEREGDTQSNP